MYCNPFFYKCLLFFRKVTFCHFCGMNVEKSNIFIIYGMYVSRVMLFRLVEHLDNNTVKMSDFGHSLIILENAKVHNYCNDQVNK